MLKWLFGFFILFFTLSSQANIVILGIRIIYEADKKNISVQLENNSERPALVQAWLDDGRTNVDPSTMKLPFVITPACFTYGCKITKNFAYPLYW